MGLTHICNYHKMVCWWAKPLRLHVFILGRKGGERERDLMLAVLLFSLIKYSKIPNTGYYHFEPTNYNNLQDRKIENYYDELEAEKIIGFEKSASNKEFKKKNIFKCTRIA